MTTNNSSPYDGLEKLFHEPKRLAIVSMLCTAKDGASFAEMKRSCGLTDGNLNRHLNTLEQAGAVRLVKESRRSRPQTFAHLTPTGREQFNAYLRALEGALKLAVDALQTEADSRSTEAGWGLNEATVWP